MRLSPKLFCGALLAGVLAGGLSLSQSVSADDELGGSWLPLPRLIEKLDAAGYRNIEKIERDHGRYEVRATNRQGERSKLRLDARTGELVEQRRSFEKRSAREAQNDESVKIGGECNERRCRDDLPAGPAGSR